MLTTVTPSPRHWLKCLTICLGCLGSGAFAEVLLGTVIAVHDGDTITLQNESGHKKIRLAGIDAPELNQPYGFESRGALRDAVIDKQIQVENTKSDRYGRIIGKVIVDGKDMNLNQVKSGMAWAYREYLRELSKVDKALYLEAEAQSKAIAIGLWQDLHATEPWVWRKK